MKVRQINFKNMFEKLLSKTHEKGEMAIKACFGFLELNSQTSFKYKPFLCWMQNYKHKYRFNVWRTYLKVKSQNIKTICLAIYC